MVASFVLAGGALTGKYSSGRKRGRLATELDAPRYRHALELAEPLRALAGALDTEPCRLAIAYALTNARVASVLFGATTAEQVRDDVAALQLHDRLDPSALAELRSLALARA